MHRSRRRQHQQREQAVPQLRHRRSCPLPTRCRQRRRRRRRRHRGRIREDGDCIVLDVGDFTSWEPHTWQYMDDDKIQFPTDPMLSICYARSYFAVTMILFYEPALREKHTHTWDGLTAAWKATFHQDLSSRALEKWPEDRPHGFNAAESAGLAESESLRYLKHGPGRPTSTRRRVVPAAAGKDAANPPPPLFRKKIEQQGKMQSVQV
jgi:hypothetical protein